VKLHEERTKLRQEIQRQIRREDAGLPVDTREVRAIKDRILDHHDHCPVCNA
jgi:hypothetical protein